MNERARIVVIDDDRASVDRMERVLAGAGYDVARAYNGVTGLAAAFETRVDLVCLDLRMPALDGEDVCLTLRGNDRTRPVPILVVSQLPEQRTRASVLAPGADDDLPKAEVESERLDRVAALPP